MSFFSAVPALANYLAVRVVFRRCRSGPSFILSAGLSLSKYIKSLLELFLGHLGEVGGLEGRNVHRRRALRYGLKPQLNLTPQHWVRELVLVLNVPQLDGLLLLARQHLEECAELEVDVQGH